MRKENRIKLKVKGLNQEKLLNKITKNTIVYNFKRDSHNTCQFEVDYKQRKMVKSLLTENGMEIVSQSHNGIFSFVKRFFMSYGVMIALGLSVVFYPLQYGFILKIEVIGESQVDEKEIKDFAIGNLKSRYKSKIDTKELEFDIKENFKEISSVSVAIVGQTLAININEATLPEEMEGQYLPLLSEFEGLITKINLIQGTLAVNEGSIVKKGDILVYPYVIDAEGEKREVAAKAEIFADVWISEKIMHYDYSIIVKRTGKVKVSSNVYLKNLLIYSNKKSHNFNQFDVENEEVILTKNLLFPFKLKRIYYYETETVEIKEEFNDVKDKIIESLRLKTLIFLEENEIIKEEKYTIREEGGCHEINYLITVNRNIGG